MKQLHKPLANATDRIKISSKGSKFFIAVLIGGLATFFCSILLIQGIRKVIGESSYNFFLIASLHYRIITDVDAKLFLASEQNNLDVPFDC